MTFAKATGYLVLFIRTIAKLTEAIAELEGVLNRDPSE